MHNELWEKIVEYDFDNPMSEFGFSLRLASENNWTNAFTKLAIHEYKKFMYLAAVSDTMVSPSEVVDDVWHQHLIFSQSYNEFAKIIGKQVQHLPSTGNKEEHQKFRQAKERTKNLYRETFGDQPKSVWGYQTMFDSLHLEKGKYKIRTVLIFAMFGFLGLIIPFYYLLQPVYVQVDNPDFIIGYLILSAIILVVLELINRKRMSVIVNEFTVQSFVYNLQPLELIYMQSQKPVELVHVVVNELIRQQKVRVNNDNTIEATDDANGASEEGYHTLKYLENIGKCPYPLLVSHLLVKPIFLNIVSSITAFKKYVFKSKKFGKIFYLNLILLAAVLLFGVTRVATGLLRDRPISLIILTVVAVTIITIFYLYRLTALMFTITIPELYKKEVIPVMNIQSSSQWGYFLLGTAALSTHFSPLVGYVDRHKPRSDTSSGGGSSCGSSCGSSSGGSSSGCGGCGGGD